MVESSSIDLFWWLMPAVVAAVVLYGWYRAGKVEEAWEEAARQLGLEFVAGGLMGMLPPVIKGELDGIPIKVRVHTRQRSSRRRNKRSTDYTEFKADLGAEWLCGVQITKRGLVDKMAELFGGQDIEIGDPAFDEEFRVRGEISDNVRRALMQQDAQLGLRRLVNSFNHFQLEKGTIRVRIKGKITNPDELIREIRTVAEIAADLDDAAVSDASLDQQEEAPLFPDPSDKASHSGSPPAREDIDDEFSDPVW